MMTWSIVWKMSCAALLVDVAVVLLYLAEKRTRFGKLRYAVRQTIYGLVFGGLAVFATEFGVDAQGATINVRDAAPLCAGLVFGAPAGVIAGVIGGVERWFAVYWGAGEFTRLACSISTVLAGLFGALLRKYMFDDRKPSWIYGLSSGLIMEVLHMLMFFLTNISDFHRGFELIEICALPMILFNGLSVMLGTLFVALIGKEKIALRMHERRIAQTFQRWLLICVVTAFVITSVFTFFLQTRLSVDETNSLLRLNISDVCDDIQDASDNNLLRLTRRVATAVKKLGGVDHAALTELAEANSIAEINIINEEGFITVSTNDAFVGFDMASGEQSREFLTLLDGKSSYVQSYQPIAFDSSVSRKYGGVALTDGGFLQVGYDAAQFQNDIADIVVGITRNRHIGANGCIVVCDERQSVVSDRNGYEGFSLSTMGVSLDTSTTEADKRFVQTFLGAECHCMYTVVEGYLVLAALPSTEVLFTRDVAVYIMAFMEIILFGMMFAFIYFLVKKLVVDNIDRINSSLAQITDGNLNVTVDVRSNVEFSSLSDDINMTVSTLKRYIAEAAARIDKELEFAKAIQHSALPSVFPPFPTHREFDIYAWMDTAKEVGGDFYDFYFVDERHVAFLIADVSGKGIPAAMFMMTAKTTIKGLAEAGKPVAEVLTQANAKLCEGNDAGMFVTAWIGVLDIHTGHVDFANAGHNPPLLRQANGAWTYLKARTGFVLAGMDGVAYRSCELQLAPGDCIYLYTDGVTEANNAEQQLYGEDRLKAVLDANPNATVEELTALVKADVDRFVGEAAQFDDMTMLALRFNG